MYACNRMMPGYSLNYLFSETHGSHGQEKQHISTCAEIKNHVHKHSLHFILNGNKEEESKQSKIGLPVDHQNEDAEDKKEGRRSPSSNNISKTEDTQTKSSSSSSECSKRKRTIKYCSVKDCPNRSTNRGVCFRHGGGKRCSIEGCESSAKKMGLCWKHGGSLKCKVEGCRRRGKSRGLCWAHGGGTSCKIDGCTTIAVSKGLCWAHGGGTRCTIEGCRKAAYKSSNGLCDDHFYELKEGKIPWDV